VEVVLSVAAALAAGVVIVDAPDQPQEDRHAADDFLGLLVALLGTYALGRVIDLLVDIYDIHSANIIATTKVLLGIGRRTCASRRCWRRRTISGW